MKERNTEHCVWHTASNAEFGDLAHHNCAVLNQATPETPRSGSTVAKQNMNSGQRLKVYSQPLDADETVQSWLAEWLLASHSDFPWQKRAGQHGDQHDAQNRWH